MLRSPNHTKIIYIYVRQTEKRGSNVYSLVTMLLQISHIIVSIFSGVILVTVCIKKWQTY